MLKHIETIIALLKTIADQLTKLTVIAGKLLAVIIAYLRDQKQGVQVDAAVPAADAYECPDTEDELPDTDDELLDTPQVVDLLETDRATFYRRVYHILLWPTTYRGCIPVYSKKKVETLKFSLPPHQKGAHTYSRASAKKRKNNGRK